MKPFKALYIDNGVIKAGEFPVEPELSCSSRLCPIHHDDCECDLIAYEHEEALASAKANAVECEDQEEAKEIIAYELFNGPVVDVPLSRFNENIIPLPSGWDYRVENRIAKREDAPDFKVAKLYRVEEQPEPEESQDKLWMNVVILVGQNIDRQGPSKVIQQLEEQFTITRRK